MTLQPVAKFNADRGTHLAAMIAYFALLSLVPLVFLSLALLGLAGRADESSFLVTELKRIFPGSSVASIVEVVNSIRDNAATLGIIGGAFLFWTSLSLFNALESALNIVYGKPNRSFLHGKAIAVVFMIGSVASLFVALLVGSFGFRLLQRATGGALENDVVAYVLSIVVSTGGVFAFLISIYYLLTNERMTLREVLPGSLIAAVLLEASFQVLPLYLRLSSDVVALQAFGAPAILLVWLYVMANVIVLGAEVNWWLTRGRRLEAVETAGLA